MGNANAKTSAWNRVFAVLDVEFAFNDAFLDWFNLARACWIFLQEQKFDVIVANSSRQLNYYRCLIITKRWNN